MAKRKRKRSKRRPPEVTVRFANEGRMAKRRRSGGKRRRRNANPSNPRRHRRRAATHRRRRNPRDGFGDRFMKLAGGAAVALAAGTAVVYGMAKLSPTYPNLAEYGLPAAGMVLGAAIYRTHPTLGAGLALGSVAPFALPLGSKLLTATSGTATTTTPAAATTAAGIGRAIRAVQMGAVQTRGMGAVQMGRAYRMYG